MRGQGKWKTRQPAASFGTIPTFESPGVARPGIEPAKERVKARLVTRGARGDLQRRATPRTRYAYRDSRDRDFERTEFLAGQVTRLTPRLTKFDLPAGSFGLSHVGNVADFAINPTRFLSSLKFSQRHFIPLLFHPHLFSPHRRSRILCRARAKNLSIQPKSVIVLRMEQHRNERVEETRDPRENPPTNSIARHDSYMQFTQPEIEPGSPW
ncbi:hypothetical protein PR048_004449 [Dryococelus australis]|uniref:Uncharacterized protein n=1 Tax=Dryococelus australis TaxID=614101 RepID=A0ABQ9I7E9_9NEOP|nr:hypothetical protein PR048_004449 [Dryococelus australis]